MEKFMVHGSWQEVGCFWWVSRLILKFNEQSFASPAKLLFSTMNYEL